MRERDVPVTESGRGVLVVAQSHNLRHHLLQIGPINREIGLSILHQAALRVVDWITTKNKQVFDMPLVYVRRQLCHANRTRVMWKLPNDQRLSEILECSVDPVNQHLDRDWLAWTSQHDTYPGFREKIIRSFAEPFFIENGSASGILQRANQCTQTWIVRRTLNFLRESMRKRCDLA